MTSSILKPNHFISEMISENITEWTVMSGSIIHVTSKFNPNLAKRIVLATADNLE
jgi:hypothetical protein